MLPAPFDRERQAQQAGLTRGVRPRARGEPLQEAAGCREVERALGAQFGGLVQGAGHRVPPMVGFGSADHSDDHRQFRKVRKPVARVATVMAMGTLLESCVVCARLRPRLT
ncbi:hypothetical protein GCM10017788_40700 [Amycolatopsis acidiphila]|nr:hypothetical protein GCM10017788_40700 [Amycolatopsis acidiphila]